MPRNWDQHYADPAHVDLAADPLLMEAADLLPAGLALDLACGPGRHALYLARLGWRVTAVDSSAVAIGILRSQSAGLAIDAHRADLERGEFAIARGAYDLICDFFYLQRSLFAELREGVSPGGVFAGAIHLFDGASTLPAHSPEFLLRAGELRSLFDGWKVIYYSEGVRTERSRRTARIIARRA